MLTFLVRKPEIPDPAPENNFENAVGLLFPDNVQTFHGDAGSRLSYLSKRFGDIELSLSCPDDQNEHLLFAHHIWNSGIQLSEFISQANDPALDSHDSQWNVKGERVLDVGAGA